MKPGAAVAATTTARTAEVGTPPLAAPIATMCLLWLVVSMRLHPLPRYRTLAAMCALLAVLTNVPLAADAPRGTETTILAGGCFWGMEDLLRKIPGVVSTDVGYEGGQTANPTYDDVHTGTTGHAESVRVVFDPKTLSYEDLLEKWFFRMHDPTTKDRQGNDVGTQYRSAIFVTSETQRQIAERVKQRVDASGKWSAPLTTEIVTAGPFTPAEEYHQKYLQKHPDGYTCHYMRN